MPRKSLDSIRVWISRRIFDRSTASYIWRGIAIKRPRLIFKPCVFVASLIPVGWLAFALWSDTFNATSYMTADPVQKLNRELGDWALIFIIITLAVRPFADLTKKPRLMAYRRMIGLYAFFYALLHVTSYVGIDLQLDLGEFLKDVTKRNFILVGMVTLILLIPLAVTSTKSTMNRLGGRHWKKLHYLIYPISILGAFHFFLMIRADFSRPIIYAVVIFVLLAYRIWAYRLKARSKKSTAKATKVA